MTVVKISAEREKEAIERLAAGVRARQVPDPIGELQAENTALYQALRNLVDAVARARKANDAVKRNSGFTADWNEHEDAHASLIIRENEARELLAARK